MAGKKEEKNKILLVEISKIVESHFRLTHASYSKRTLLFARRGERERGDGGCHIPHS